jgi:8-amino-7-oxononanoate synthase
VKPFECHLQQQLQQLTDKGLLRQLVPVQTTDRGRIQAADQAEQPVDPVLNLAGNDYLGLAGNQQLLEEFYTGMNRENRLAGYGCGSGASRLMTGNHDQYRQLEQGLARMYGTEKALVFNSGYHINIGLLPALSTRDDLILADKLCHASLIDGMRLSRAKVIRYPHLDYERLEQLLKKHCGQQNRVFVVTESIFSMDGDCADLAKLVRLKEEYGAIFYVDEAHAAGVRGRDGLGLAEEQGVSSRIDLLVATFGKAWAGQGAFVACSGLVHDFLVNTARSLIFTTGLPPVTVHWLNFILARIQAMGGERQQLARLAEMLRRELAEQVLETGGETHIVPVMIGDAAEAVAVAGLLRKEGYWVNAVRPPTVPAGTARLRLSLTAAMDAEQLVGLAAAIAQAREQVCAITG